MAIFISRQIFWICHFASAPHMWIRRLAKPASRLVMGIITSMRNGGMHIPTHGPLTRYVYLRVAHAPGMLGTFSRHQLQRKPLISDPGMHHGTCVTHVPWCMSGSLNRGGGENAPGIPGACAIRIFTYLSRGPCPHCNGDLIKSWFWI